MIMPLEEVGIFAARSTAGNTLIIYKSAPHAPHSYRLTKEQVEEFVTELLRAVNSDKALR